jgi:hypothetical protein
MCPNPPSPITPSDLPGWFMLCRIMGVYTVIPAHNRGPALAKG